MNKVWNRYLGAALVGLLLVACAPDKPTATDEAGAAADTTAAADAKSTPEPAPAPAAPAPAPTPAAPPPPPRPRPQPRPQVCADCGTVAAINQVQTKGSGTGAGAVAGAVGGGVIGHQFGKGRGKDAATVAGAIIGALAGNEVEKKVRTTSSYQVTVAMDDGSQRQINVTELGGLAVGTKVRVEGDLIYLR